MPTFEGLVFAPAERAKEALHRKTPTVHGKRVTLSIRINSPRLPHSLAGGSVVVLGREIHERDSIRAQVIHKTRLNSALIQRYPQVARNDQAHFVGNFP